MWIRTLRTPPRTRFRINRLRAAAASAFSVLIAIIYHFFFVIVFKSQGQAEFQPSLAVPGWLGVLATGIEDPKPRGAEDHKSDQQRHHKQQPGQGRGIAHIEVLKRILVEVD